MSDDAVVVGLGELEELERKLDEVDELDVKVAELVERASSASEISDELRSVAIAVALQVGSPGAARSLGRPYADSDFAGVLRGLRLTLMGRSQQALDGASDEGLAWLLASSLHRREEETGVPAAAGLLSVATSCGFGDNETLDRAERALGDAGLAVVVGDGNERKIALTNDGREKLRRRRYGSGRPVVVESFEPVGEGGVAPQPARVLQGLVSRAEKALLKGDELLRTATKLRGTGFVSVDEGIFTHWRVMCLSLMTSAGRSFETYERSFRKATTRAFETESQRGMAVLRAFREELNEQVRAGHGFGYDEGSSQMPTARPAVFVVHGHDVASRDSLLAILRKQRGFETIVLGEEANRGQTIIEKFEENARRVRFAIVLATPDDVGCTKAKLDEWDPLLVERLADPDGEDEKSLDELDICPPPTRPRARQNVILEWGYFAGKLGRNRVMLVKVGDVELPSDLSGILETRENFELELLRELKAAGLDVDFH